MDEVDSPIPGARASRPAMEWFGWIIGPVFALFAWWLAWFSPRTPVPIVPTADYDRSRIVSGPRRLALREPPTVWVGGYEHECNSCHRFFSSPPLQDRSLVQHTDILLDHGMNNRCFNCHDRADRERLSLYNGDTVAFNEVPRLCAQCHGTVFRDWQRGTHGKTLGSWDAASGVQRRLACNDCHDPHAPAYERLEPLPGPRTLRMGDQHHEGGNAERHIPLRRWSSSHPTEPATGAEPRGGALDHNEEIP